MCLLCLYILFSNAAYFLYISTLHIWTIGFFNNSILDNTISHLLIIWTFRFLNNSIFGYYYFTSSAFYNFWVLVFSLLSSLLRFRMLILYNQIFLPYLPSPPPPKHIVEMPLDNKCIILSGTFLFPSSVVIILPIMSNKIMIYNKFLWICERQNCLFVNKERI